METIQIRANGNETLDEIAFREYKEDENYLIQVIKLNPHLASKMFLPAGEIVLVPRNPPEEKPTSVLRIFGEANVPD